MTWIATKTLAAIDAAIVADGGNAYRDYLRLVLPYMSDAYSTAEDGVRSHLGASVIGQECARATAYGWLWANVNPPRGRKGEEAPTAHARMLRLWNRGHLEEGRLIAALLAARVEVYPQDTTGKQYRVSAHGGHFGGSSDGVAVGIPDLPVGIPCLLEFKTHSDKSFAELRNGVEVAKPQHYVQMQIYMGKLGLQYALYLATNKNDDTLHAEIVTYRGSVSEAYLDLARSIIYDTALPNRLPNASPAYFHCKHMCDHTATCFKTYAPRRSCRTCENVQFMEDGTVQCNIDAHVLTKDAQVAGCTFYKLAGKFK